MLAYPYFYSDSDYDSGAASQPPQVVVVQAAAPAPPPAPPAPRESLLIEWQGDHFVRTTSTKDSAGALIATDYSEKSAAPLSAIRTISGSAKERSSTAARASARRACISRWPQGRSERIHHHERNHLFEGRLLDHGIVDPEDTDRRSRRSRHAEAQPGARS